MEANPWNDTHTFSISDTDVNWTTGDDFVFEESSDLINNGRKANVIALGVIFTLALLGNAVVFLILLRRYCQPKRKRDVTSTGSDNQFQTSSSSRRRLRMGLTNMQWFMLILSAADILGALFTILPQLIMDAVIGFHGNNFVCKSVKYLQVAAMYASTYCMLMLSIDLYISVCRTKTTPRRRTNRVPVMACLAWVISLLFAIPQAFIFSLKIFPTGHRECWATFDPTWTIQLYVMFFVVFNFLAPLAILVFCYARICCEMWSAAPLPKSNAACGSEGELRGNNHSRTVVFRSNVNAVERFYNPDEMPLRDQRKLTAADGKLRMLKLSLTVIIAYIICWMPFVCVNLWVTFAPDAEIKETAFLVMMRMANLNSCTNPWIYLFFSALWRRSPRDSVLKSFVRLASESSTGSCHVELRTMHE